MALSIFPHYSKDIDSAMRGINFVLIPCILRGGGTMDFLEIMRGKNCVIFYIHILILEMLVFLFLLAKYQIVFSKIIHRNQIPADC